MSDVEFSIRTLDLAGLEVGMEWAALEGWNPGVHDAEAFHATDPEGFLFGVLEGTPVALISAVRYGAGFGFLGLYIVRPEYRGRGYGMRVWEAAMARLRGRTVGLDGVPSQQDNYRKSGFVLAHRNVRYRGIGEPATGRAALPAGRQLRPLAALPFAQLIDYDRAFFADERSAFVRSWISRPLTQALGWVVEGRLCGYAVMRPCRNGYKIGPLFADTPAGAEALFAALHARVPTGAEFFLDVPQCQPEALALAQRHGLSPVFDTARMYAGPPPEIALARTYGITSFELG